MWFLWVQSTSTSRLEDMRSLIFTQTCRLSSVRHQQYLHLMQFMPEYSCSSQYVLPETHSTLNRATILFFYSSETAHWRVPGSPFLISMNLLLKVVWSCAECDCVLLWTLSWWEVGKQSSVYICGRHCCCQTKPLSLTHTHTNVSL